MVTTRAGSSASPPDRADSPPAPPDGTGSLPALPDRSATPPVSSSMFGNFAAPTEADILAHVLANVLRQPSDSPLARALDEAGINEINDLLTLDHHTRKLVSMRLMIYLLLITTQGTLSPTNGMMVLPSHFPLATRIS